ncbi:hypothetical protein RHSIM_Rhsim05G0146800 [Rhododendron simsii]|uniref:Uncharacterized protein n=1 Tax=Rhododendron simsii TaxID=118357 RepID=A0A834GXH6_RHOSS|nr:hypothetical protein RHSIM_Rhsim05G0146800 [Rhododendron simsii]
MGPPVQAPILAEPDSSSCGLVCPSGDAGSKRSLGLGPCRRKSDPSRYVRPTTNVTVDLIAIGNDEACQNLSGADLSDVLLRYMNEAAMAALEEKLTAQGSSDATSLTIKKTHFEQAQRKISPSVSDKVCMTLYE